MSRTRDVRLTSAELALLARARWALVRGVDHPRVTGPRIATLRRLQARGFALRDRERTCVITRAGIAAIDGVECTCGLARGEHEEHAVTCSVARVR